MTQALIVGAGAVGLRVARQLLATETVDRVVLQDVSSERLEWAVRNLGDRIDIQHYPFASSIDADVVVISSPQGTQLEIMERAIANSVPTVMVLDGLSETVAVLRLEEAAREANVPVIIGAGFAPGLSCLLAAHASSWFDSVDEIHIAKVGTGGPACALVHHRALSRISYDWREEEWVRRPGGSGRELCWFPDPVGARDCYRAALPDPILLHHAFPSVKRITARMAATRRDRLTASLPMLMPPHPEGGPGAIRVEIRGYREKIQDVVVLGSSSRPAVAAAALASLTVKWILNNQIRITGMGGMAEMVIAKGFLSELFERGIRTEIFEGDSVSV